jgi:hypothetical protein
MFWIVSSAWLCNDRKTRSMQNIRELVWGRWKRFENGRKWSKMVENGRKWSKMVENGRKWYKMVENSLNSFRKPSNIVEPNYRQEILSHFNHGNLHFVEATSALSN